MKTIVPFSCPRNTDDYEHGGKKIKKTILRGLREQLIELSPRARGGRRGRATAIVHGIHAPGERDARAVELPSKICGLASSQAKVCTCIREHVLHNGVT